MAFMRKRTRELTKTVRFDRAMVRFTSNLKKMMVMGRMAPPPPRPPALAPRKTRKVAKRPVISSWLRGKRGL